MKQKQKSIVLIALTFIASYVFAQKQPETPKSPEHTETYRIMEKYGFTTQAYPGENAQGILLQNYISLNKDNGNDIYGYFLVDDGVACYLKKSVYYVDGRSGYGRIMPKVIDITGKIKSAVSAYGTDDWTGKTVLKNAILLIEGPVGDENLGDFDILLEYNDGKDYIGIAVILKDLLPFEKGKLTDLNELASQISGQHPEWKWYIENFDASNSKTQKTNNNPAPTVDVKSFLGTWKLYSMLNDSGIRYSYSDLEFIGMYVYLIFNNNGTGELNGLGTPMNFKWDGNSMRIYLDDGYEEFSIRDGKLYLGDGDLVFVR